MPNENAWGDLMAVLLWIGSTVGYVCKVITPPLAVIGLVLQICISYRRLKNKSTDE